MDKDKQIKKFEKAKRWSRGEMPVSACLLVVAVLVLWLVSQFITVPTWIVIIVPGVIVFTLIGDVINYIYCNRKLKVLKKDGEK